jgi:hypothetical protein
MAQLVPVAIELAFTLRAGHPENFRHDSVPRRFSRKGAKFGDQTDPEIRSYLRVFASLRERLFIQFGFSLAKAPRRKV